MKCCMNIIEYDVNPQNVPLLTLSIPKRCPYWLCASCRCWTVVVWPGKCWLSRVGLHWHHHVAHWQYSMYCIIVVITVSGLLELCSQGEGHHVYKVIFPFDISFFCSPYTTIFKDQCLATNGIETIKVDE